MAGEPTPSEPPARTIEYGLAVRLLYTLALPDGTPLDEAGDEPLFFVLGDGTLDAGLERGLLGLRAGQRARLELAPGQAFGWPDLASVHRLPRADFPADLPLSPGAVVEFTTPSGLAVAGIVQEVGEKEVTVDFSHPLAGQALVFHVEVIAVGEG
jgi:FKBP-type peptidyl-prolyl cis-trans isomerase SlpA